MCAHETHLGTQIMGTSLEILLEHLHSMLLMELFMELLKLKLLLCVQLPS